MLDLQVDNPVLNEDNRHLVLENVDFEDIIRQVSSIVRDRDGRLFVSFAEYG